MGLGKSTLTADVRVPGKLTFQKKSFDKLVDKLGPRIATKIRQALRAGKTYDGDAFPPGEDGQPIDLSGESRTLLRSIRYNRKAQSVEPRGGHPTCRKGAYGLMQILLSGKGKHNNQLRPSFDAMGSTGNQVYEDAAKELEDEISKATSNGTLVLEGSAYRIVKGK